MPRLGSKKSRSGCAQCKARRVKVASPQPSPRHRILTHIQCDEGRPCGACTRYRVECSLLGGASQSPNPSDTASPRSTQALVADDPPPINASTPTNGSATGPLDSGVIREKCSPSLPGSVSAAEWMQDLELTHHYTAHAYQTMPGTEHVKQIWGFAVPQEAFKYPFLLHSILAFSANHLAYINPSRAANFRMAASSHQSAALTSLNQAVANIGRLNCHAIFAAASMTVINAFADARAYNLDVLVEIFHLVRGMDYVLSNVTDMLKKGPFAAIVLPVEDTPKPPSLLSAFLVEIQALSCPSTTESSPEDLLAARAAEVLRNSLQYAMSSSTHPALRATMIWPISVTAEFIEALKSRTHPEIRAILKHYCKLLEYASTDFWFYTGWRGISQHL